MPLSFDYVAPQFAKGQAMRALTLEQASTKLRRAIGRLPQGAIGSDEDQVRTGAVQFIEAVEKAVADLQLQVAALQSALRQTKQ